MAGSNEPKSSDPRRKSADDNLAEDNFPEINRAYYAAEPADYFEQRLNNLLVAAGNPDGRAELIRKGGKFGELKFGEASGGKPDPADTPSSKAVEHFVLAETEVLAHHVGETLLRLCTRNCRHARHSNSHEFAARRNSSRWCEVGFSIVL